MKTRQMKTFISCSIEFRIGPLGVLGVKYIQTTVETGLRPLKAPLMHNVCRVSGVGAQINGGL